MELMSFMNNVFSMVMQQKMKLQCGLTLLAVNKEKNALVNDVEGSRSFGRG